MDTNTKKRYLVQMLANAEQLQQGAKDLDLVTDQIEAYKIYLMQEYVAMNVKEREEDE